MSEPVTAIFFSCRRLDLLRQTVSAFMKHNTYPISEYIIVNDSASNKVHNILKSTYRNMTLVLNKDNVGLIKSIDLGYAHVKTNYLFHCEDDWMVTKGGFMEKSLTIMEVCKDIEEVWLADYNNHPVVPPIYYIGDVHYMYIKEYYLQGEDKTNNNSWHGFTTALGLKRMSDYRKVAPYADIPWKGTIWHREQAIGERYHQLGYRSAVLMEDYAINIGYGQSEYKTGYEK